MNVETLQEIVTIWKNLGVDTSALNLHPNDIEGLRNALLPNDFVTDTRIHDPVSTWGEEKDDRNASFRYLTRVLSVTPPLNHTIWITWAFDIIAGRLNTLKGPQVDACTEFVKKIKGTSTSTDSGTKVNNFKWENNSCFIDVACLLMCSLLHNRTDILLRVVANVAFTTINSDNEWKAYIRSLLISGCYYMLANKKRVAIGDLFRRMFNYLNDIGEGKEGSPLELIIEILKRYQLLTNPTVTLAREIHSKLGTSELFKVRKLPSVQVVSFGNNLPDRELGFDLRKVLDPHEDFSIDTCKTYFVDVSLKKLNDLDITHLIGTESEHLSKLVYIVTGACVYSDPPRHYKYVQWTHGFEKLRMWDSAGDKENIQDMDSWALPGTQSSTQETYYTILRYEAFEHADVKKVFKWFYEKQRLTLEIWQNLPFPNYDYLRHTEMPLAYRIHFGDYNSNMERRKLLPSIEVGSYNSDQILYYTSHTEPSPEFLTRKDSYFHVCILTSGPTDIKVYPNLVVINKDKVYYTLATHIIFWGNHNLENARVASKALVKLSKCVVFTDG
jgi:hypothetical protein